MYHLAAGGHTSRYEFTKAIIDIMKKISGIPLGWASVEPTTSDQFPLPVRRLRRPAMSIEKIKRVFGIEMPQWNEQLRSFLKDRYSRS